MVSAVVAVVGESFIGESLVHITEAFVDCKNGDSVINAVTALVKVPCRVFCKTVDMPAVNSVSKGIHPDKAEAVGLGPTNSPSLFIHHVDTAVEATVVGDSPGCLDHGVGKKATAEHALVNFIGFTYTGNVWGGVSGDRPVSAPDVVGHEARCEPHTNDVGN